MFFLTNYHLTHQYIYIRTFHPFVLFAFSYTLLQITIFTSIHFSYLFLSLFPFFLINFSFTLFNATLSNSATYSHRTITGFLVLHSPFIFFSRSSPLSFATYSFRPSTTFSFTALRTPLQLQICPSVSIVYFTQLTFTVLKSLILLPPYASA